MHGRDLQNSREEEDGEQMIGQTISHYTILAKLGEGGMGVVYKAEDTTLKRTVALKFLPSGVEAERPERARFLQEAQAAAALNHPNICTIHDILTVADQQFIVMEFVDGTTLRERIPVRKIQEAVAYALQIAEALQEAHSHGVVHRDIKADNIMVNAKNQIKVMDFGLARLKGSLKLTRTTSTVGTLAYMAPEQIQGGEVDARSDIFSFGVLLYEMLTGHLPFRGEHEAAMVYSIVNEPPFPIQTYLADAPSQLVHVIDRALEKSPEDRYQTIQEMAIELRRVKRDTAGVSRVSVTPKPGGAPAGVTPAEGGPLLPETPMAAAVTPGRRKWLWVGGSVLGIAAVAFILFKILGNQTSEFQFRSPNVTRLTTEGIAFNPAISPDGKYVAYATAEKEQRTLWLKQLASGSTTPLLVRKNARISTVRFSSDGNYLYFSMAEGDTGSPVVFQIPVIGGAPRKVKAGIGRFALSPDDKRLAFAHRNEHENRDELLTVNFDGTDERVLATFPHPTYFLAPLSWSPDGVKIAGVFGEVGKGSARSSYRAVGVAGTQDGSSRVLGGSLWEYIGGMTWLPDGNGLIVSAGGLPSFMAALWYVSYPDGAVRRVTNDLMDYSTVSLTADGENLVVEQGDYLSSIWIVPDLDMKRARQVTPGYHSFDGLLGITMTRDQKVLYTSSSSGGQNLWSVDQDGGNRRQITFDSASYGDISVSYDGKYLILSRQVGSAHGLVRMDMDGSNVRPIGTTVAWSPSCSPVSPWTVYTSFDSSGYSLWKVRPDSGAPVRLSAGAAGDGTISPDGELVACFDYGKEVGIVVIPFEGGEPTKKFVLPRTASSQWPLQWTADGRGISFIDNRGDVSNIWMQPLAGGPPQQLTHFTSDVIYSFGWSRDGRILACARGKVTSDIVMMSGLR